MRTITLTHDMQMQLRGGKLSYSEYKVDTSDWPDGITAEDVAGIGLVYDWKYRDFRYRVDATWTSVEQQLKPPANACKQCWDTGVGQWRALFLDPVAGVNVTLIVHSEFGCWRCLEKEEAIQGGERAKAAAIAKEEAERAAAIKAEADAIQAAEDARAAAIRAAQREKEAAIQAIEDAKAHVIQAASDAKSILPPLYHPFHFSTLEPYAGIALPLRYQQVLIDQVRGGDPNTDLCGHSVHFSGPSHNGKSVLACALVTRMFHVYAQRGFYRLHGTDCPMPIYRLSADLWSAQMEKYEHRDFATERDLEMPEPNIHSILGATSDENDESDECYHTRFPPVLLLEEIDKFSATETRVNRLNALLSVIFDNRGMVISTSNLTKAEFDKRFGDYFRRRLTLSPLDNVIRHRDLHDAIATAKRVKAKRSPILA